MQALVDTGSAYEISTAGIYKEVGEIYPARDFVQLASAAGVPIVISSDSHRPGEVGRDFDQAIQLARDCGYRETLRFSQRQRAAVLTFQEAQPDLDFSRELSLLSLQEDK